MDCWIMGVNRLCGRSAVRAVGHPLKLYGRWDAAPFVWIDLAPSLKALGDSGSLLALSLLAQVGLGSPQRLALVCLAVAVELVDHCCRVLGWFNRFQSQSDLVNAKGG